MRGWWMGSDSRRGQWALIALLIATLIIGILAVVWLVPKMTPEIPDREPGKSMPQAAMEMGRKVECTQNLRSIRQAITMYRGENDSESPPASLKDLRMGVGPDFFKCPVGHEDYIYDPNTGTVRCPHPGHEKL